MTKDQIAATVNAITGLMTALRYATAADKAEIYAGLGLHLTYHPGPRTVTARAESRSGMYERVVSEGDLNRSPISPRRAQIPG
jgi:hypothetical protein